MKRLFWIDATALHGRSHADTKLIQDAASTAIIVSTANLINIITTIPFLELSFAGMGWLSPLMAKVTYLLVLIISNEFGIAAVARTAREQSGAKIAWSGFLLINFVLSLTAGPGVELLLNQSGLAEQKAQELIEAKVLSKYALQQEHLGKYKKEASELESECHAIQKELTSLSRDNPNRDILYIRAFGAWSERNDDWIKTPIANWPVCRKADHLANKAIEQKRQVDAELEAVKDRINQLGPIVFLKKKEKRYMQPILILRKNFGLGWN